MNIKKLKIILPLIGTVIIFSCTKVKRDDDFPKGDPPAVPGGFTNSSEVASADLIAYWSFDGEIKDAVTGTTGNNHGMTFSTGLKGDALTGSSNPDDSAY